MHICAAPVSHTQQLGTPYALKDDVQYDGVNALTLDTVSTHTQFADADKYAVYPASLCDNVSLAMAFSRDMYQNLSFISDRTNENTGSDRQPQLTSDRMGSTTTSPDIRTSVNALTTEVIIGQTEENSKPANPNNIWLIILIVVASVTGLIIILVILFKCVLGPLIIRPYFPRLERLRHKLFSTARHQKVSYQSVLVAEEAQVPEKNKILGY